MLELLKKIGLPATVAAIIASLVTLLPVLLKIDERYAKAEELALQIKKVEDDMNLLSIEIGKLAGTQQVLVSIMSARVDVPKITSAPTPIVKQPMIAAIVRAAPLPPNEPIETVELPTTPPTDASEMQTQLDTVNRALISTQRQTQQINRNYQSKK